MIQQEAKVHKEKSKIKPQDNEERGKNIFHLTLSFIIN